jgi:hypothetical protein
MPQNAEISFYATPAIPMTSRQVAAPDASGQMEAYGWLEHAARSHEGLQAPQGAVKMENKGRHDGRLPAH